MRLEAMHTAIKLAATQASWNRTTHLQQGTGLFKIALKEQG